MPLSPNTLADALEQRWLTCEGRSMASSTSESADRLAGCIAPWFAQAIAAGFPCATALARKAQLASQGSAALAAGSSAAAGGQLASAIALYVTGQSFGSGVAQSPTATALLASELAAVFADLRSSSSVRAQRFAAACSLLCLSTLVSFPHPPFTAPIT